MQISSQRLKQDWTDRKTQNYYSTLITDLASLIEQGRKTAVRYVNTALVATYWLKAQIVS